MQLKYSDVSEFNDYIDTYSLNGDYLGVQNRAVVHDKGILHYAIHCWVFGNYNGRLTVVFQKRKSNKRLFPGKYDVAAAGHYLSKEFGRDGLRELTEELKLPMDNYDISYYKTINCRHYDDNISNNELCNVYFCKLNTKLTDLEFDSNEIEDLIFCDVEECIALLKKQIKQITVYSFLHNNEINVIENNFIQEYRQYFIDTLTEILKKQEFPNTIQDKSYTFVMLKPDAIKRNLVPDIISFLRKKKFEIELFDVKIALDDIIFSHYADKIIEEGEIYKEKAHAYFHDNYVIPMIISLKSDNIIQYTRKLVGYKDPEFAAKNSIRGKWGIDSMQRSEKEGRCCENLIHASDSFDAFKRECLIWFKRTHVEKFFA